MLWNIRAFCWLFHFKLELNMVQAFVYLTDRETELTQDHKAGWGGAKTGT